jgi:hypothetical protein
VGAHADGTFHSIESGTTKKNRKEKMKEKKIGNNNINYTIRERDP